MQEISVDDLTKGKKASKFSWPMCMPPTTVLEHCHVVCQQSYQ